MAELRKITRGGPISNFQQVAPYGGEGFRVLAAGLDEAYKFLEPIAIEKERSRADADWRDYAKSQIGADAAGHLGPSGAAGVTPSAQGALDGLQKAWGKPLNITSAFRTPEHNAKVGGAKNSQHTHGNAFDVDVSGMSQSDRVALITQARVSGFRGVGVYDNSLHFDVGPDRAWGPSYHSDSLPGWAAQAVKSPIGGAPSGDAPSAAPVMIRDKDGKLQPRLYSPSSSPILQAYNQAAGVAYLSEMGLQATTDMMKMSFDYSLDPEGFKTAVQGYVDQIVENAPEQFKPDLRASLTEEAGRRFNGMLAEKQQDTQQRAINSSGALADRYADDLAEAIAVGNPDDIAAAQAKLQSVLVAREALPGLSWTPEQSQNKILDAQAAGQAEIEKRQKEKTLQVSKDFDVALAASKAGMTAEAEGRLLHDPIYAALYPERVAELQAWSDYRDLGPTFDKLPIDEQDRLVRMGFAKNPESKHEVEIAKAMASRAVANREAKASEIRVDNTVSMLSDSSTQWDPYDSEQRKLVDEAYTAMIGPAAPLSQEGMRVAADVAKSAGFVPSTMVDAIRTALHSGDPVALATAMEFAGQVSREFPAIFGSTDGGKEVMDSLSDYRFYSRYSSAEDAALSMVAADLPENVERREQLAPLVAEKSKALAPTDIESHFSDLGVDVTVPQDEAGAAIMAEYKSLFEKGFVATGNVELAKQRALSAISRVYGPSGIDGSDTLMRYPPTSFYPARDGTHDWMRDQLERDVTAFATGKDMGSDEETRNWFGSVKSGFVGADRIRLVSDSMTQDDVASGGRAPSYSVQFLDDDGVWQLVPGRYRFDVPSQFSVDQKAFEKLRADETKRSNIEAWRQYFIDDPNRSKSMTEIIDLLASDKDRYQNNPPPEGY